MHSKKLVLALCVVCLMGTVLAQEVKYMPHIENYFQKTVNSTNYHEFDANLQAKNSNPLTLEADPEWLIYERRDRRDRRRR